MIQQTEKQHENQPGCRVRFATVLLVTLVLELLFLFAAARETITAPVAVLLHLLLLVALFFWQRKWFHCEGGVKRRTVYLLLISTALFGPVGVAGTLLAITLHACYKRTTTRFDEWYAGLFPKEPRNEITELTDFIEAHRRLNGTAVPDSFRDILASGSLQEKRDAIVLISNHFCPEFAPALRNALLDQDNSIRVMAASSIARIENRFLEKAIQLDREAANAPDDIDVLLRQARLYDDYAFTGLLERDREEANRKKAGQIYRKIIKLQPENYPATLGLGRLLIRAGKVRVAAEWLKQTLQFRKGEPQLVLWYAESLYRLRRYRELRRLLREHGSSLLEGPGRQRPQLADVIQVWQQQRAPSA